MEVGKAQRETVRERQKPVNNQTEMNGEKQTNREVDPAVYQYTKTHLGTHREVLRLNRRA